MTASFAPRAICERCTRPESVCVCDLAPALSTRTRVLLLQHPRERRMAIGTARLAHLGIAGSALRVGLDFSTDPVVQAALRARPAPYVLFPGEGATDLHSLPKGQPVSLIVLDGTWTQAKKLLRLNPALAALPRLAFCPSKPSGYQIRKQPAEFCVSTIEALGEVLTALEPEGTPVERLLDPFFAMIKEQQRFAREVGSRRHRRDPGDKPLREPQGLRHLRAVLTRVVCVHGEANAWPRRHPSWQPAETVHWLAHRPLTGETYEAVVRPRRPLAPSVLRHLGLGEAALAAGLTVGQWRQSWQQFLRPDDVLIFWGSFPREVAALDALALPPADFVDLRTESAQWFHRKAGPVEAMSKLLGADQPPAGPESRGFFRLRHLVQIIRRIAEGGPVMPR